MLCSYSIDTALDRHQIRAVVDGASRTNADETGIETSLHSYSADRPLSALLICRTLVITSPRTLSKAARSAALLSPCRCQPAVRSQDTAEEAPRRLAVRRVRPTADHVAVLIYGVVGVSPTIATRRSGQPRPESGRTTGSTGRC